jgi:ABC-type lipoprotein release transport system permease subunit
MMGVIASLALGRVLESLLFGVNARDVLTLAAVPVLLVAVAVLAASVPALRAARINPTEAIRSE